MAGATGRGVPGRSNLPAEVASFVGRQRELAEAADRLLETRLLTLTGVGGCGKTHLALRLAASLRPRFADGVWLVELAPLAEADLVARAAAATLGVSGRSDQPILVTLSAALAGRELLLLLDNCEHLIGACAQLSEALLRGCPRLRILATSREPLRAPGETIRRVPPLSLPPSAQPALEALARSEAVSLFVDRARARQPHFSLSLETAPAVAEICRRLDGLPLAIELAAAQLGAMPVQQLARQVDDALRLLRGGSRTVARQQTLRATLDWSHALLSDAERTLFRRLAVFAGEFGAAAAEHICACADVPLLLGDLVDKSLVEARVQGPEARYRLLEPVRQYAWAQLAAQDEAPALQRRHAEFFTQLAEAAEPEIMSAERGPAVERLAREEDNLRAALSWSRRSEQLADVELGLRLASTLGWFWNFRGQVAEGLDWLGALLAKATPDVSARVRADALHMAGELTWLVGHSQLARARLDESAALYRGLGDQRGLAYVLQALAMFVDKREAEQAALEALHLFEALGDAWGVAHATFGLWFARLGLDPSLPDAALEEVLVPWRALGDAWGIAQVLNFLGDVARSRGQDARARACYEEALQLLRSVDISGSVASLLHNLGWLAVRAGDGQRALELFQESLMLFRNQGDQRGIADCLEGLAGGLETLQRPAAAAHLFGAADALRTATGASVWPTNAADVARSQAAVRAQLGEPAAEQAWSTGRGLSLEQALGELPAVAAPTPAPVSAPTDPLSPRERDVAALVARGLTNKEIAAQLIISERTAATHVAHILDKLGLRSRAQIAAWGAEAGLLAAPAGARTWGAAQPSVILQIVGRPRAIRQPDDVRPSPPDLP